jgi:MFS family permease
MIIPEDEDALTPRPPRRWWHVATVDVTPLRRHRDFRLLFIGRFVSFFGSMISSVALPYQVYQLTHNVLAVGVLGLVEFGPILVFAFVGGALADARDRRTMILLSEAALLVCSVVLVVNAAIHQPQAWLLFVVAALWGVLDAIQRPSLDALLPRLVDRNELTSAAALGGLRGTLGQIIGPALGGVVASAVGIGPMFQLMAIGAFVAWLLVALSTASTREASGLTKRHTIRPTTATGGDARG